ncbi:MAG: sensor histidine kinase [Candidatus Acidiferrales bacterium]
MAGPRNQTLFLNMPAPWDDFDLKLLETPVGPRDRQWTHLAARDEGGFWEYPERLEFLSLSLPDGLLLQVGKSTENRADTLDDFLGQFALVLLAVLAIGFAGGALLARRSLRPVRDLASVMRSIRKTGDMVARVPTRQTGDELDELAGLFNALLERIESLVNRLRSALDTIAHELRTPMTRLRGAAEMALRSNPDPQTYRQALADCLEEAEQTLTTLNTLMDVAEAEAGAMKLEWEEVDLPALVGSAVGLYEHVAEDKGVSIHTALPEKLSLRADPRRLRQVLANLLDNAIKYTPPGGHIEVQAHAEPQQVLISVRDTGIGIEPEELPKIWDRLYRGEASHSQPGLGLGLSLVRAVIQAHKGSLTVHSKPGQGSQFVISLPADLPR